MATDSFNDGVTDGVTPDISRSASKNNFREYQVTDVETVADFLSKYYKPERYTGRGYDYAAGLLHTYEAEVANNGYTFISHHDSVTGYIVAFFSESSG